jgi:hypothetical protein
MPYRSRKSGWRWQVPSATPDSCGSLTASVLAEAAALGHHSASTAATAQSSFPCLLWSMRALQRLHPPARQGALRSLDLSAPAYVLLQGGTLRPRTRQLALQGAGCVHACMRGVWQGSGMGPSGERCAPTGTHE